MIFNRRKRTLKRLLIVEDEPLVAFDNEYSLQSAGYEIVATVDSAAKGREGLDSAPDLVVLDINISGEGTGIDVAAEAARRKIPVLFVTGECPPSAKCLGMGVLAKPYNQKQLVQAIEAVDCIAAGEDPGKLPPGLTIFSDEDRVGCSDI